MAAKPKLDLIEKELKKDKNFSLTDESYNRKTGAWLPRNKSYTENKSALALLCKSYGFKVTVIQQKKVRIEKIK